MSGIPRARGRSVAYKVRIAFEKAGKQLAAKGTINGLADVLENMIKEDPFRALDTVAKFIPKELLIDQESTVRIISGEAITAEDWEKAHGIDYEAVKIATQH